MGVPQVPTRPLLLYSLMLLAVLSLSLTVLAVHAQSPQLTLQVCSSASAQQFYYYAPNSTFILAMNSNCIDILAWGTTPGSEAYTAPCHHEDPDPAHQNQEFVPPALALPGQPLVELMSNLSLTPSSPVGVGSTVALGSGGAFYLRVTSPANGGTGTLVHAASSLCLDAGLSQLTGAPASLRACTDDRAAFQTLNFTSSGAVRTVAPDMQTGAPLCLAAADVSDSALLQALPCSPGDSRQNFTLDPAAGSLLSYYGGALDTLLSGAAPGMAAYEGLGTTLSAAAAVPSALWALRAGDAPSAARLLHVPSGLCLDLGRLPWGHGCLDPQQRTLPYCDPLQPVAARVADLVGRLTTAEKVALTGANTGSLPGTSSCDTIDPGVPRLAIPPKQWLVETNSMAASQCYGTTCATSWPAALNLAASGNATLWREKGRVISDEMRALNNLGWHRADGSMSYVGLNGFGPDINAMRTPLNGRAGELVADCPFLTGAYAVEMVRGMQEGEHPSIMKMTAGVKHMAGYSMETGRFTSTGNFSLYDLWDTYLLPYEQAFTVANAAGSMCSYISLSIAGGPMIPACVNSYLLQTLTREYWGQADAYHTSDCGAVAYMRNKGFTKNDTYSAAAALNGGMDLNSNTILPTQLGLALALNLTTLAVLDASVSRTLTWRFRTGMLDPLESQPEYMAKGLNVLGTAANRAAAMEGSAQGLVLIKNTAGALPLKAGQKLAVLGPMGQAHEALLGDLYADAVCPFDTSYSNHGGYGCVPTLGDALTASNAGGLTTVVAGVSVKANDSTWGAAIAAAAAADTVLLALGSDSTVASEGTDLSTTALPGLQSAFALAVLAAVRPGTPVTLVLVSSFPLSFDELLGGLAGVVLAYNPGFGASAVAGALYGVNRWGRSIFTHYPVNYTEAVALNDFSMVPGPHNPGRSYRYYTGLPAPASITVGEGLSYSTLALNCSGSGSGSGTLALACTVATAAGPAGDQVLQVYHRPSPGVVARVAGAHPLPLRSMRAVTRVAVPGVGAGAVPVAFELAEGATLGLVNATGARLLYAGVHFLDVWDGSVNNVTLSFTVAEDGVVSVPPVP